MTNGFAAKMAFGNILKRNTNFALSALRLVRSNRKEQKLLDGTEDGDAMCTEN